MPKYLSDIKCCMNVEEFEVDRLYQSGCPDITNLYAYHRGHGRK
jgi:hypothetical protein